MSNPVRELLQDQPALASGPHMAHIGRALTQMGFENIESARKICASIMDGSRVQNSHVRATAQTLLEAGSSETDEVFTKRLERYEALKIDEGEIPDNFELLRPETSLGAFMRIAMEAGSASIHADDLTDQLVNMTEEERKSVVLGALHGDDTLAIPSMLPMGLEID